MDDLLLILFWIILIWIGVSLLAAGSWALVGWQRHRRQQRAACFICKLHDLDPDDYHEWRNH
jgi:hypothetical protein